MSRRVWGVVVLLPEALLVLTLVASAQPITAPKKRYHTWPPSDVKSNQPRFDLLVPKFNPKKGPFGGPSPKFVAKDRRAVKKYNLAQKHFQAMRRALSQKPPDFQKARHHEALAYNAYRYFNRHRRKLEKKLKKIFRSPLGSKNNPLSHYQGGYKYRLTQLAAAAHLNQGTGIALTGGRAFGIPLSLLKGAGPQDPAVQAALAFNRQSVNADAANHFRKSLTLYGALRLKSDTPVKPPLANHYDLGIIAQAHNNLAVALYGKATAEAYLVLSKQGIPATYVDGNLKLSDADFGRWLLTESGRRYLSQINDAVANLKAALKYRPGNKVYFYNLYQVMHSQCHGVTRLVSKQAYGACQKQLAKMKGVLQDKKGRMALIGQWLAPPPVGTKRRKTMGAKPKCPPAKPSIAGGVQGAANKIRGCKKK